MNSLLVLAAVFLFQEAPPQQDRLLRKIGSVRFTHQGPLACAALSPDGRLLATGDGGRIRVWDFASGKMLHEAEQAGRCVAFSRDGAKLATAGPLDVHIFETATWTSIATLKGHVKPALSAAFSPDGARLATASDDVTVRVWDVAESKELFQIEEHLNTVFSVAYSNDGATIASGSRDGTIRLWSALDGKPIRTL